MDLIVTKWIAMEGAVILERDFGNELGRRFPRAMMDEIRKLRPMLDTEADARAAASFGAADVQPMAEGGIFTALWKLAERAQAGLEVDLRRIPVKQEIIEICEYFDLNPYNMLSGGSLLICVSDGLAMVSQLEGQKIPATLIGRTTHGNERMIRNQEHARYLDRPQREELYRLYKEGWKR